MNAALWAVQVILAIMFVMAGAMRLMKGKDELAEKMGWVEGSSQPTIRLIGMAEIMGAIGLIAPALTEIAPILTPVAAFGLAVVAIGAMVVNVRPLGTVRARFVLRNADILRPGWGSAALWLTPTSTLPDDGAPIVPR